MGGNIKTLLPHGVWVLGLTIFVLAFLFGAGNEIPYQDPAPELLAKQASYSARMQLLQGLGLGLFVFGLLLFFVAQFKKAN